MNIVLIGMRGSGKTTIGRIIARKLKRQFIETDDEVVKKTGKSIPDIVREHGWNYFREIEAEVVGSVSLLNQAVISTGGGAVELRENITRLKKSGFLIFLSAPADLLVSRTGENSGRPILAGAETYREDIENVLQRRQTLYEYAADDKIDSEDKSIDQVVAQVLVIVQKREL